MSTLLAIWSIWLKIEPNEKIKQYKTRANWMELKNAHVWQIITSFTTYYINCVYLRVWISKVYV